MATQIDPFKRGDTPVIRFEFESPSSGFDWTGTTLDVAMTDVAQPADNSGAAALRLAQTLTPQTGGVYYEFLLTVAESKALTPGAKYNVEAQLKQGADSVVTPVTLTVKILQDYII